MPDFPLSRRRGSLLACIAIVLALLAGIGLRQPSPPDEPRFVLAARAMVDSGQWLLPHRGSELYAEKPPVFMWMQAASHQLFGGWNVAFLVPSLLAGLLTLWLTWDLARRLWNRQVAGWAVLALFSCLQFGLMAKRAQIDMVLVAMTTLAMWGLLRHLLEGGNRPALWLAGFAAGLGTVTKGVGFLPLLVLLPWALWRWRSRDRARPATAAGARSLGWLLPAFLLGTVVWLAPLGIALLHDPDPVLHAYARELLFKQTGTRYANAWHHVQPAWYYLQVIATLWLPGSLLLPALLPAWWRRLKRLDGRYWLLLGWALLVLVFFSASPGKREVYIFPMLPLLCVAAAPLLPGLLRRAGLRWLLLAYAAVLAVAALYLGVQLLGGGAWAHAQLARRQMPDSLLPVLGGWMLGAGILLAALVLWLRQRRAGLVVVVTSFLLWNLYGWGLMPALDPYSSASALMQRVGQRIGPQAELGLVAWREQNLLQADRPITEFGFKRPWDAQWRLAGPWLAQAPQRRWLLVLDAAMSPCVDRAQLVAIGSSNRNRWQLLPGTAWRRDCDAHLPAAAASSDDQD
ncbi:ArnT family glycosyltransferase [Stenotrophomonas rhizophila]|uniref:ArnT family glycosyltransferase n=1 Tax=Stenotrophomonas rhizophila TaxID=216778 RepID=UPI001E4664A6|nr:glycosyltransferase family 39 protein [Stenotrophomonas rhizophila]MCC7632710.1 glycosyltransferase family 39 protein [Stenotrophomonas rhizophila]MCC7663562.1 glycosyltransferase family 39 protein [Stenotrophomonas rhizophila]